MSTYELHYLEETHSDGSVKHTYIEPVEEEEPIAKPLDPNDDPVYEVVEDCGLISSSSCSTSKSRSIRTDGWMLNWLRKSSTAS